VPPTARHVQWLVRVHGNTARYIPVHRVAEAELQGQTKVSETVAISFLFFVSPVWKRELRDNPPGRTCSIPSRRPRRHLQKFCYIRQMPGTLYSPKRRGALWYNRRSFQQNGELKSTCYNSTVSSSTRNSSGVLIFQACGIYQFRNSLH
jgi:hypothetical protein